MREFVKNWILPPAVRTMLSQIRNSHLWADAASKPMLEDHNAIHLQRNHSLCAVGTGSRCFILGTGPSLNDIDLRTLKDEYCIGLNSAYHHPDFRQIQSRYTIISGLACHPYIQGEAAAAWVREIAEKAGGRPIFLNIQDREAIEASGMFNDQEVYYFQFSQPVSDLSENGISLTAALYRSQNVAMMAMQVAIGMGFSTIILLGLDHDMILHVATRQATHFYSPEDDALERAGFFDYNSPCADFGWWFSAYAVMWDQYRFLKAFASANNIRIYNASTHSLLDIFPRIKLADIL